MKRIASLILLFIGINQSIAQDIPKSVEKELSKAVQYFEKGKNVEAAISFASGTEKLQKYVPKNDTSILAVYNLLSGYTHDSIGEYEKAKGYYEKTYEAYVDANSPYHEFAINALFGLVYDCQQLNLVDEGLKYHEKIANVYKVGYGEKSVEYAVYLNDIAIFLNENNHPEAINYYAKSLNVFKAVEGPNGLNVALVKNNLALMHFYRGSWSEGEKLYREVVKTYSTELQHEFEYFQSLTDDGAYYYQQGDFAIAKPLFETDLPILDELLGENNDFSLTALIYLSDIYSQEGNQAKNLECQKKAYAIQKSNGDVQFYTLKNLAHAYLMAGVFDTAQIYYDQSIEYYNAIKNPDDADKNIYAIVLDELSLSYKGMKQYDKALELNDRLLRILRKGSFDYIKAMGTRGDIYFAQGKFIEAEKIYTKRLELYQQNFSESDLTSAIMLGMLAYTKVANNQYDEAEVLYNRSLELFDQLGASTDKSTTLNNYALMYKGLGNYKKAIPIYKELLEDKSLEKRDPMLFFTASMNLAICYIEINELGKGKEQLDKSNELATKYNLENTPNFALFYSSYATYYQMNHDNKNAMIYFEKAFNAQKDIFGPESPQYYNTALKYAGALLLDDRVQESIELFEKLIDQQKQLFGKVLYDKLDLSLSLAGAYLVVDDNEKAYKLYEDSKEFLMSDIYRKFSILTEDEKEMYFNKQKQYIDYYNSFCLYLKDELTQLPANMYDLTLQSKGILLNSGIQMRKAVLASNDEQLKNDYNKWIELNKRINSLEFNLAAEDELEKLQIEVAELEKKLVKQTNQEDVKNVSWQKIQKRLKEGEVAIEFLHFKPFGIDVLGDKEYVAIILKQSGPPQLIKLFNENMLEKIVGKSIANSVNYANTIYGTKDSPSDELYQLIWKPIELFLTDQNYKVNKAYLAKDGLLHKVAFDAMYNSEGKYVSNDITFVDVLSTQNILNKEKVELDKALVVGGVDYGNGDVWKYLEGTKSEADKISAVLQGREVNVHELTGKGATESVVREQSLNKDVIHIATHGFFFPEVEGQKAETVDEINFRGSDISAAFSILKSEDALKRSGIALTNANEGWSEGADPENDGILTASEVKEMNLSGTKLVVLSACETGLGDIKGSEGVYGLQRAFKMAGAERLVMSLWQVPDKETVEFMSEFYKNLEGLSVNEAFKKTQQKMKEKYSPYFWAAFILVE